MKLILEVCGRIRYGTCSSARISSLPQPEIQCHHISPQRLIAHKSEQITELITTYRMFLVTCAKSQNPILWPILSKQKCCLNIHPIINCNITSYQSVQLQILLSVKIPHTNPVIKSYPTTPYIKLCTLLYLQHRKIRRIMYVQRNIEERSRNHCYRAKPINIIHFNVLLTVYHRDIIS
jgi:hypothetical protein